MLCCTVLQCSCGSCPPGKLVGCNGKGRAGRRGTPPSSLRCIPPWHQTKGNARCPGARVAGLQELLSSASVIIMVISCESAVLTAPWPLEARLAVDYRHSQEALRQALSRFYHHHDLPEASTADRRLRVEAGRNPPFLLATSLNCLSFNKSYILRIGILAP